ncbi:hypothetical protein D3C73_1480720 [compost metagenome]
MQRNHSPLERAASQLRSRVKAAKRELKQTEEPKKPEQQHRLVILRLLELGWTTVQMLLTPLEELHLRIMAGQEGARRRQRRAHK